MLTRLSEKYSSQREFADAIGVDATRLNRAINGDTTMFDVLRCFYVADATSEDPLVVLRAAGKGELAAMIEKLCGPGRSEREQRILRAFAKLSPEAAAAMMEFFDEVIAVGGVAQRPTTTPRRVRRLAIVKRRIG